MVKTKFNCHRSTISLAGSLLLGGLLGVSLIYYLPTVIHLDTKFEELALGKENTPVYADLHKKDHCVKFEEVEPLCIGRYRLLNGYNAILWFGNSQLHSINQKKTGDELASDILYRRLNSDSKYLITFSQPNANLQEHYLMFLYFYESIKIDTIILPVVFDDMRETGIRSDLSPVFDNSNIVKRMIDSKIGQLLFEGNSKQDLAGNQKNGLENTIQDDSERYLDSRLSELWDVWGNRATMRGNLYTFLYQFRNWVFNINPTTTRLVIPGRYLMNKMAFEEILKLSSENKINVLVYIPPLRNDIKIPYDVDQYDQFKTDIGNIANNYGVKISDFEAVVPAQYWGTKDQTKLGGGTEVDFMHFKGQGHVFLAEAVYVELQKYLNSNSR